MVLVFGVRITGKTNATITQQSQGQGQGQGQGPRHSYRISGSVSGWRRKNDKRHRDSSLVIAKHMYTHMNRDELQDLNYNYSIDTV